MAKLNGGEGNDTISGTSSDDIIDARDGNDIVYGRDGNDSILGGADSDQLFGNGGNDTIIGGFGLDTIYGGDGNDQIIASGPVAKLFGEDGNDSITGSGYLNGGIGDDVLVAEGAASTIIGGAGNDTIATAAMGSVATGERVIDAGSGDDTVYFYINGQKKTGVVDGGAGTNTLFLHSGFGQDGDGDTPGIVDENLIKTSNFRNFHTIYLSTDMGMMNFDLELTDAMFDESGEMLISSYQDKKRGSFMPPEQIVLDASAVTSGRIDFYGTLMTDVVQGGAGNDRLQGTTEEYKNIGSGDQLFGGGGNDTLIGAKATDLLFGETGRDYLIGNGGTDSFTGGAGDDTIDGGDGLDVANYSGNLDDYEIVEVTYNTFEVRDLRSGKDGTDTIIDVNKLRFADQDYSIVIAGLEIIGDDTNETFDGGNNADHIDGAGGTDRISGNGGNDNIEGGAGSDLLDGDGGSDFIDGGTGGDTLNGGTGIDELTGGTGDDVYQLGDGKDIVIELKTTATVRAAKVEAGGVDTIFSSISRKLSDFANVENITLVGTKAANATGNGVVNELRGNSASNVLSGIGGADRLAGGLGADILTGGAGADLFEFSSALGKGNVDQIKDFSHSADGFAIDNAVFAKLSLGKLSSLDFKIIGSATSIKGVDDTDRILYDKAHGDLYFDRDGSGTAFDRVKFADVSNGTLIDHSDFLII